MPGIDQAPPPFFKRGPAPLALLSFYVAASIALFVVDLKYHSVDLLRQAIAIVVDPLQRLAQTPAASIGALAEYARGMDQLQQENAQLRRARLDIAPSLARLLHLEAENDRLRRLLDMKEREKASGQIARILFATRDPFSRRIVADKGGQVGIVAGQPVIDGSGVVGQVTRVSLLHSEITLITDKNQIVPVQVVRNGLRSVVYGLGGGQLELRYLPANADIKEGDLLVTSGLDGIFLSGFPVARVKRVERDSAYAFARIVCEPVAAVENFTDVFILSPATQTTPLPKELTDQIERKAEKREDPGPSAPDKPIKKSKGR
ncbi:MAG: Cell shape-determining protein MreC [Betaproteobacteria bacterium ADurb.Bin341]|nr:MAG: Cell shape-determining protein MreC [Betaproteobacteria bacterium ADurb.Bin341]